MARRSSPQQTQANGHGRLSSLREQVEEQELRAKLAAARQQARLVESVYAPWGFGGSWGDVANPFGYRLDATGGLWLPLAGGSLHSRQAGRYRPFAWADIDLDHARSLARWLAAKNDLAIGALKAVVNFTVKKGYTWKTRPSKGNEKSPAALQLAAAVQRLIDDHSDRNGLPARERSACRRAVRDGEAFVRHFAQDDGTTVVRFVEPEQVREQAPAGHDPDGAFGVVTAPGDVEDVRGYCVTYDGVRYETVDASEVSHIKRNVDECVKRGLSDFFSSGEALDDVSKLLRNMRVSGSVQAAVAWTEQFKGMTLTQVQAHVAGIKDLNRGQPIGPLSGRELNYQKIEPGTVRKVGEGMEQVAPPVPVGASVHIQIVQSALRAVGCRWNMPEYMVSGDSSGANFAGTLVAGSPFVNSVECEQDDFGLFFLRWRWVAVRNACEAGLLGPYTFAQVQDLIDIHFTPPQVAVAKEAEQATIDHEDIAAGVMSLQTRRARRGLDDEQERENLRLEPPTRLAQRAQDLDPHGNPVGGFGRGQSAAGGIRPDLPKPAPPGSKDGPGLPTAVREVKDDAGHEHADDGKFTGTGGGGGVTHDGGHATATPVGRIKLRDGVLGKALDAMGGAAAGAKAAAGRFGEAAWASLDDDDRRVLSGAYAVGRWVARRAETLLSKGRQLSGEIARERGLSDEQAARVERVVGLVDTIAAWTVNVPVTAALTGNPLAGKAAGLMPVASMAYLAYSTARNPLAVLRAAKTTLTTATKHESVAFLVEGLDRAAVEALCDGYKAAEDPDWYTALVLAALDLHGHDLAAAVGAANEAVGAGKPAPADDPDAPVDVAGLFESRDDTRREFAGMMAEVLYGLFGDDALRLFKAGGDGEGKTESRLWEAWSELDHPRGKNGRFIPRGSAEARSAARDAVSRVVKGDRTPHSAEDVARHLAILTVKQLREVWKEHGRPIPSWVTRRQLVDAVMGRLPKEAGREPGGSDGAGGGGAGGAPPDAGRDVAPEAGRPAGKGADREGNPVGQPAREPTPAGVPAGGGRAAAGTAEVSRRLDRYEGFFRAKGQHHVADWLGLLRGHVAAVGADEALAALGGDAPRGGDGTQVQYWGVGTDEANWRHMGAFMEAYLARNGITAVTGETSEPGSPLISALGAPDRYVAGRDFKPAGMHFKNKLDEARTLPGLESSEDVSKVMGREVTHLTPEVTARLDERYGAGRWIVKCYDDNAAAGYGIFFPQRAQAIAQDARNALWDSGRELARYGFAHLRDDAGRVVGVRHEGGDEYRFGTDRYEKTIQGDARHWADRAAAAAPHERGAMLPEGSFMAQPAFAAVGISDAERAAGKTWHERNEGRVHLVTRPDGSVEVVPHATWLKGGSLPVVFEDDDTRAMAAAAKAAVEAIPHEARKGQVYAPDVMKTADGYRVVELNPQGDHNGSGYLHDNHFTIDAYVSHLTGRVPQHVRFIRDLLSRRVAESLRSGLGWPLLEAFDAAKHPRGQPGNAGQFGPGGGSGGGADAEPEAPDADANRPSHPDRRHKAEDGSPKRPPARPWKVPPPKLGKSGEGMAARPKGDDSQTRIGDLGEGLALRLGFRSILPAGRRSHKAGENAEKGSTIDLEFDHSGRAYELKLCNTTATEYRLKAKAKEKAQKQVFADRHGLTPHVLVGVRDVATGEVHFYAGREPGFLGAEVSEKNYDYVGSVKP